MKVGIIEKILTIKGACIKANPSIMELSFGCEIKRALTEGGGFSCSVLAVEGNMVLSSYAPYQKNYEGRHWDKKEHIEILGRPIRLADVLKIADTPKQKEAPIEENQANLFKLCALWVKNPDDLREQPEEVIDFIIYSMK